MKLNFLSALPKGKLADLLILDKNPIDEISNIQFIHTVFSRGKKITDAGGNPSK